MSARITSRGLDIVNPSDASWTRHRYVIALGAYGWTRLLIWANTLECAIEHAAEWCEVHAPGLFCDETVRHEYKAALAEGLEHDEACERAEVDTIACDGGHYFLSWEVQLVCEDPTRADLLALDTGR